MPKESTDDVGWLAKAGENDWVVLKRDKRIRNHPAERAALISAKVRTFCLTSAGNYSRWNLLRLITASWPKIEEIATTVDGPYVYSVTWEGVNPLALTAPVPA